MGNRCYCACCVFVFYACCFRYFANILNKSVKCFGMPVRFMFVFMTVVMGMAMMFMGMAVIAVLIVKASEFAILIN